VRKQKIALLVLLWAGMGEGQNQMCNLCGWLKKFRAVGFFIFSFASLSALFRCLAVADNVFGLCVRAGFGAQNCQPALNLN